MAQYIFVYLGGNPPASPEEGAKHFAKYKEWLASISGSVVSPANPLKNTTTISPDGTTTDGGTSTMSGFTIVEADSMQAALGLARDCPFLEIGGSLEVSELLQMSV